MTAWLPPGTVAGFPVEGERRREREREREDSPSFLEEFPWRSKTYTCEVPGEQKSLCQHLEEFQDRGLREGSVEADAAPKVEHSGPTTSMNP